MICLIIFIFILFSLYIQFSPTIGYIWLRPDSNNNLVFCPSNLFRFIIQPFINPHFWQYNLLDINFIVFLSISMIIYHNIIYFYKYHSI